MNAKITEVLPAPAVWLSAAWAPFSGKLATALGALAEDQCLVLSVKGANRPLMMSATSPGFTFIDHLALPRWQCLRICSL